ncbi:MAG: hypothetical protein BGN84_01995 [Afipia sp. 62-7]|nr:MAG: hypothetical protein BGN84_01995 [Afipia sp. 62-7]
MPAVPERAASARRRVQEVCAVPLLEAAHAALLRPAEAEPSAQRQAEVLQPSEPRAAEVARPWALPGVEAEQPSARQVAAEVQDGPRVAQAVRGARQEVRAARGAQPEGAVQGVPLEEVQGARPAAALGVRQVALPSAVVLWADPSVRSDRQARLVRRRMTMRPAAMLRHAPAHAKAERQRLRWSSSE